MSIVKSPSFDMFDDGDEDEDHHSEVVMHSEADSLGVENAKWF